MKPVWMKTEKKYSRTFLEDKNLGIEFIKYSHQRKVFESSELSTHNIGPSSANWNFRVVTWLPVIGEVASVMWRQRLAVDGGEGMPASIPVQWWAICGDADCLSKNLVS